MNFQQEIEFLEQSNAIEGEYSEGSLRCAMDAWSYAKDLKEMSPVAILNIHGELMKELRPDIAGQLRDCVVYIGGKRLPNLGVPYLRSKLFDHCEAMNGTIEMKDTPSIVEAVPRYFHVDFEHLHPFEDGNGRVGRIIMNWHRLQLGLDLLIIHEGEEQREYYSWF